MSGIRESLMLGAIPVVIGVIYLVLQATTDLVDPIDLAGVAMLIALGLAMGFGMFVILRGARDL
jgi:hypothetical protein